MWCLGLNLSLSMRSEWKEGSFRTHSSNNEHPLCAERYSKRQEHRSERERWYLTCRLGPQEDPGPRCSPVQAGQSVELGGGLGRLGVRPRGLGGWFLQ